MVHREIKEQKLQAKTKQKPTEEKLLLLLKKKCLKYLQKQYDDKIMVKYRKKNFEDTFFPFFIDEISDRH